MAKQSLARPLSVLLTRPLEQGQALARRLDERFGGQVEPILSPLMAPVFLAPTLLTGEFDAVIFTSATGVAAAMTLNLALPGRAFCVGRQTAKTASAAGFTASSTDGDAEALLASLLAEPPKGRLLHLRGEEARGNLAERLTKAGIPAEDLVIYRQDPQPLDPRAVALLRAADPVILPLFSPRSAVLMAKALPSGMNAPLYLAALSPSVGELAAAIPHAALITAARPDADAMLDAVATLIVAASPP
jgi:uroporphyrinogen-III synthase